MWYLAVSYTECTWLCNSGVLWMRHKANCCGVKRNEVTGRAEGLSGDYYSGSVGRETDKR